MAADNGRGDHGLPNPKPAHLTNTDVPVPLFDPPTQEGETNGFVRQALDRLKPLARDLFRVVRSTA